MYSRQGRDLGQIIVLEMFGKKQQDLTMLSKQFKYGVVLIPRF